MTETRSRSLSAFLESAGWARAKIKPLAGDASFRRYWRLQKKKSSVVLVDAPPLHEDIGCFLKVSNILESCGLSVPQAVATDLDHGFALLEDLGDNTFNYEITNGRDKYLLYESAVDVLVHLQRQPKPGNLDTFNQSRILQEVSLLIDWTLPALTGERISETIRSEYFFLWSKLVPVINGFGCSTVLFDYHVDNLIWLANRKGIRRVGLLDYQDAIIGPMTYDLVSLLEDARRDVSNDLVKTMIKRYLLALPGDEGSFYSSYAATGAQRNTRILGVFGRLFLRDGKADYLPLLPRVWRLLEGDLEHPVLIDLYNWYRRHVPQKIRIAADAEKFQMSDRLRG